MRNLFAYADPTESAAKREFGMSSAEELPREIFMSDDDEDDDADVDEDDDEDEEDGDDQDDDE